MTGYTYEIADNNLSSAEAIKVFMRAFIYDCDKLPEKFEVDEYYNKEKEKALKQYKELANLNYPDRWRKGGELKLEHMKWLVTGMESTKEQNNKIIKLIHEINNWHPSSEDAQQIKKYALEQLNSSVESLEWYEDNLRVLLDKTDLQIFEEKVKGLEKSIERYSEEYSKAFERTISKNIWLNNIKKDLQLLKG